MLKIKEVRKEKGLTQGMLAQIINVSVQTISGYETGYAQPPVDILIKIADVLEASTDYLLGREDYATGNVVVQGLKLAADEQQLIEIYRNLPLRDQAELIGFAKGLAF